MSNAEKLSSFEDLGLGPDLLSAIADCGYTTPTPIQARAIPTILMSRDMIGQAQTGSGKTASFTLPMIDILAGGRARAMMPRSLILSPTRELAAQIAENFETYGKNTPLTSALLVGGESIREQKKILSKGVDVLIATPGRLLDLFERGELLLTDIKVFVIDEADRMLDMGFIPDIEKIISLLPFQRQTLLFSATMPDEIRKLADQFLSNPKMVTVEPPKQSRNIEQNMVWVERRDKKKALLELLGAQDIKNAFIFCNRKRDVDDLARFLRDKGHSARAMHGDMTQKIRTQTLKDFKDGEVVFLVCSDVAARGLDIDAVSHVFNFDLPFNAEDYVHRIGRTGRAGQKGVAYSLAAPEDLHLAQAAEKEIKTPIQLTHLERTPTFTREEVEAIAEDEDGGKGDGRGRKAGSRSKAGSKGRSGPNTRSSTRSKSQIKSQSPSRSPQKPQKSERGSSQRRDFVDNNEKIIGFGDDIPGFLK